MKPFALILTITVLIFWNTVTLNAASTEREKSTAEFQRISIAQGLSHATIECILQDSNGYMWFGTRNGLNKYDGTGFTVYNQEPRVPGSLSNLYVKAALEDRNGNLWVGTTNGLNRFDRPKQRFTWFKHEPGNPNSLSNNLITAIYEDKQGTLWLGNGQGGLVKFDPVKNTFTSYRRQRQNPNSISNNVVLSICEDNAGMLWVGTGQGLNRFDPINDIFTRYTHQPGNQATLSFDYVTRLIADPEGKLWVGTLEGLNLYEPATNRFTVFKHEPGNPGSLSHNNITALLIDTHGRLWVGTHDGLNRYNPEKNTFTRFKNEPGNPCSLSSNTVTAICQDTSGILWIGTASGGINKLVLSPGKFQHYRNIPGKPKTFSHNGITAIYEDGDGVLWVGSGDGVLNRFDPAENESRFLIDVHADGGIGDNMFYIHQIHQCRNGMLWLATHGKGLIKYDRGNNIYTHYRHQPGKAQSLSHDLVSCLSEDPDGNLWLATWNGVEQFRPGSETFTHYRHDPANPDSLSSNSTRALHLDRNGILWVGTFDGGLNRYDPETGKVQRFRHSLKEPGSINSDNVITIHEAHNGVLWIGTWGGGLDKYDPENGTFTHYTEKNGLLNNSVCGILEDNNGNLWISTNYGLSQFNPESGAFTYYDANDGLNAFEFYKNVCFKSKSGRLLFGGENGINAFVPDNLQVNGNVPPVYITDFKLFNKPVPIGEDSPLKKHISETEFIKLSYRDNFFSFRFAALEYTNPAKNRYECFMEGLHDDWLNLGNKNTISFSGMKPGTYELMVRGANNDGVRNPKATSLIIVITPPFWDTWWFRLILLALAGLLVYKWHLSRMEHLSRKLKSETEMNRLFAKYKISEREQEIVILILKGKTNKEIENELFISIKTVKSHIYNIYRKVNVKNRLELIRLFQGSLEIKQD